MTELLMGKCLAGIFSRKKKTTFFTAFDITQSGFKNKFCFFSIS